MSCFSGIVTQNVPYFVRREREIAPARTSVIRCGMPELPRPHDYEGLIKRWRALSRKMGCRLRRYTTSSDLPVYYLRLGQSGDARSIHLSGGIHGDEPAGAAALLVWAEKNLARYRRHPFLIFPCLNPWGLINNRREDARGRDLNRQFGPRCREASVRDLKRLLKDEKFALSLTLHEDYEALGLYVYELERARPFWGEDLLKIGRRFIPIESRRSIDGRRARPGLVRQKFDPRAFPLVPEAIYLHQHHAYRVLTFETPSELDFGRRIATQVALIEECVGRIVRAKES